MSNIKTVMSQAAAASVEPDGAWDLSYAYYDDPLFWNVSSAVYSSKSFSLATYQSFPTGLSFKPDGTKMYSIADVQNEVREWSLSTAWDVNTASNVGRVIISSQDSDPQGVYFKPDGTKMYIVGMSSDSVHEYNLSTAWTVSTASFSQSFSVAAQSTTPTGLFFKPDGTKLYVIDTNQRDVHEYNLSTAWDVSSSSYLQSFNTGLSITQLEDLSISDDGLTMFILARNGDKVAQYSLSTAWDISSSSYVAEFAVGTQEAAVRGLFVKGDDGSNMYVVGNGSNTVFQYTLGGFSVNAQEANPTGVTFKPDGTKMYIIGVGTGTTGEVNEYDLSTPWDTSSASFVRLFSIAGYDNNATGVVFKPDGTKMYMVGTASDTVYEYNLSIAWNISTATYSQNFSVGAQDTLPQGLSFKPDGTKMYICGAQGDDVNEYDLSTAWNVTTASFLQNFSVNAQEPGPSDLFFKSDGTKMYIVGNSGDEVNAYDLSTAWDISTASFVQNFRVNFQETTPTGLSFKDDGTKMFIVGSIKDRVFTYSLGVQE